MKTASATLMGALLIAGNVYAQAPDVQIDACKVAEAPAICEPAKVACTEAMTNADANLILSPAPFIKNCIIEAVNTNQLDGQAIAGHRSMYINAVRLRSTSRRK